MKEKAWLAYGDAAPHLSNIEWTKMSVAKIMDESRNLVELREKIEQLQKQEEDPTRRNDLRIYLMYLQKVMQKERL